MVTRAAPGGRRTRRRRSQEERREATRGAVLDATVECLAERGYAGTTTTRIARRARVSRGALLHYYASKIELLTSAIEHILRRMVSGSTFYAWLELVVAARSDRQLLREVSRITTQFTDTVIATYRELFAEAAAPNVRFDLVPAFTFAFLQGLALDRIAIADDQRVSELIAVLKDLAAVVLGP